MIDQGNMLVNGDIDPPESRLETGDYVIDQRTGIRYKCIVEDKFIELYMDDSLFFNKNDDIFTKNFIK